MDFSQALQLDQELEQKIKDLQAHLEAARAEMNGRVNRVIDTAPPQPPAPSYDQISPEMRNVTADVVAQAQAREVPSPMSAFWHDRNREHFPSNQGFTGLDSFVDFNVFSDNLPAVQDRNAGDSNRNSSANDAGNASPLFGDASIILLRGHGASSQGTDWLQQEEHSSSAGGRGGRPDRLPPPRSSISGTTPEFNSAATRPAILPSHYTKDTPSGGAITAPLDLQMVEISSPQRTSPRDHLPHAYTDSSTPSTSVQILSLYIYAYIHI